MTTPTDPTPGPGATSGTASGEPAQTPPAPAPAVLEIDGVAYSVPQLAIPMAKLADEIDEHLRTTRPDPFKSLAEALTALKKHDLPSAVRERIQNGMIDHCLADSKDAYRHRDFDPAAVSAWLQSFDGGVWLLWRQLRQKYPDIEMPKVREAIINKLAVSAASAPVPPSA